MIIIKFKGKNFLLSNNRPYEAYLLFIIIINKDLNIHFISKRKDVIKYKIFKFLFNIKVFTFFDYTFKYLDIF